MLRGGSGADTLDGGGADAFLFSRGGSDSIIDFQKGEDRIELRFFVTPEGHTLQFGDLDTSGNGVLDDPDANVAVYPIGDTEINLTPFIRDPLPGETATLTVLGLTSFCLLSATDFVFA